MRVLLDVAAGRRADSSLDRRGRGLTTPDRGLCQEIAFGALRWKALLDQRLDSLLLKGLSSLPLTVQAILEVAAYQLLFLDRIPVHAAIDEAVDEVRALLPPAQARGLTGVVNATLRTLAREPRHGEPSPSKRAASVEELARESSHPAWLVARWLETFGAETARRILAADNVPAAVHLRPHTARVGAAELLERLHAEGAEASLHPLSPECVVLKGGDPSRLTAYDEGLFTIQDVSAQMVSRLIPSPTATVREGGPGEIDSSRGSRRKRIFIDLCAAPGGKIGAAAERPDDAIFLAADASRARLRRLSATAARMGLPLRPFVGDARDLALTRSADFVLADVPCLGTGTLRRRVDARWQISPERLPQLLDLQRAILANAATLLAPGGRLLYATCSLEPEENVAMTEWLLRECPDLALVDLGGAVAPDLTVAVGNPSRSAFFITPAAGDCDGAYAALLERVS